MRKTILVTALLTGSVPLLAQQQVVTCNSTTTRPRFCPADTRNGVILVQERSNGVCEQGTTWSYTTRGINVKGGCAADFQLGANANGNGSGANGSSSNGNGGYQNNYPNGNGSQSGNAGYGTGGYGNGGYGSGRQGGIEIPAGTRLSVRLQQSVNANNASQGDLIPATIVNDVTTDGQVVIPAGTAVEAKVVSAQGSPLDVRLESVRVNGRRYQLSTNAIHDSRDLDGSQGNQGGGKGFGALLGGIAGVGQLNSGSVYLFRLTSAARPSYDRR